MTTDHERLDAEMRLASIRRTFHAIINNGEATPAIRSIARMGLRLMDGTVKPRPAPVRKLPEMTPEAQYYVSLLDIRTSMAFVWPNSPDWEALKTLNDVIDEARLAMEASRANR